MKVAIIGANGQLGSDLVEVLSGSHEVIGLTHSDIEITDIDSVNHTLSSIKPDIVLNTAAYHIVPEAEKFPVKAFQVNGAAVLNLAKVCQDKKIRFLHYSTDYVFDGAKQKPYTEDDIPNPLNVYANTKLSGEYFALNYCDHAWIVRVSGIYGKVPCRAKGGNFITTMQKLSKEKEEVRVVDDEILTPTSTHNIARNTEKLVSTDAYGLYHMTSEGQCSWYEFACVIWQELQLKTPLSAISGKSLPTTLKRPTYSVLENLNLNTIGVNLMPHWRDDLISFLRKNHYSAL